MKLGWLTGAQCQLILTLTVEAIGAVLKKQGLATFEIPKQVKLDDEMWTPESGLVTAALKLQRNPLREFYNQPGGLLEQMDYLFPAKD